LIANVARLGLWTALVLSLAACSGGASNSRIDYKGGQTLSPLDVPPDLSTPEDTGTEEIPYVGPVVTYQGRTLLKGKGISIQHDGSTRWLLVESSSKKLWPQLLKFWASLGLEVEFDEPSIGIMETVWAENRADIEHGFFTDMMRSVFSGAYSANTRDKYRLRIEPVGSNRTEIFLAHYGVQEVVKGQTEGFNETMWQQRPSDPELVNAVLNRLVLFLGGSQGAADKVRQAQLQQAPRAKIEGGKLNVRENFSKTWSLAGIALDRIGLVIEDRNRSQGLYFVSGVEAFQKGNGWVDSMFTSAADLANKKQWRIHLVGSKAQTVISVEDANGKPLADNESLPLLQRLQESLK